jgi:5-methylcytosine-specific restriction endonuclease McrA
MAKKKIPQAVRNAVWNTYIGVNKGEDRCFVGCGEPITKSNFECGHIHAEAKGGPTDLENLRPICSACNKSIGTRNMEDFITEYKFNRHRNWEGKKKGVCIII